MKVSQDLSSPFYGDGLYFSPPAAYKGGRGNKGCKLSWNLHIFITAQAATCTFCLISHNLQIVFTQVLYLPFKVFLLEAMTEK